MQTYKLFFPAEKFETVWQRSISIKSCLILYISHQKNDISFFFFPKTKSSIEEYE